METDSVALALEREHQEVDAALEAFVGGRQPDDESRAPLRQALRALRRHIYLEEEFLFPALCEAGLDGPVLVMQREHGEIWKTLDMLEHELSSADGDEAALALCREVAFRLQDHNLKEEQVLYPRVDQLVTGSARSRLRSFIDSGVLPQGWVCGRA